MKKAMMFVMMLMFAVSVASAATTQETVKSASEKVGNFWSKEAQRAGWKDSTANWGNFWSNMNPVNFLKNQQEAYNSRKGVSPANTAMKTGTIA